MSWKEALIIGKLKLEDSIWLKNGGGDWLDKKKKLIFERPCVILTTKINFIHLASKFSWFLAIQEAYKYCIVVLDFKWNYIYIKARDYLFLWTFDSVWSYCGINYFLK
jgi:hypothetical protein